MAAITGTPATLLDAATLARAAAVLPQQRLVVATQTPQAGAPLGKGSTVQVTLIDLDSIPIILLHPDLPLSMQTLTVGDAAKLVDASPDLKSAVANPQATVLPAAAVELLKTTTGKTLTADEAGKTLGALRFVGTLGGLRLH